MTDDSQSHDRGRSRRLARQQLAGYEVELATTAAKANELVRTSFPGLVNFSFHNPDHTLLSSARVWLDSIYLATVRSSGHEISLADDDQVAILAPIRGSIQVSRGSESCVARPPDIMVVGTGERRTSLSADYLGILAKIPTPLFQQHMAKLMQADGAAPEGLGTAYRSRLAHTLRRYLLATVDELDQSRSLLGFEAGLQTSKSLLVDLAVGHWIGALERADNQILDPGRDRQRRAEEFILANRANPISVADIAAATGMSLRTLQHAFQKYRGISPYAFLAESRLQNAYELLSRGEPGDTVTALASMAGIVHLSRFAQAYLQRYGEHPSATLARAVGAAKLSSIKG